MTNQEAIKWLREAEILDLASGYTKDREAINLAISALQAQDATNTEKMQQTCDQTCNNLQPVANDLISRQAAIELIERMKPCHQDADDIAEMIDNMPSAHPEIVRCKDCKYRGGLSGFYCDIVEKAVGVDSFCSWAERRTEDDT